MALRNSGEGWGWPARLIHWTMAALILWQTGLGLYMTRAFPDGSSDAFGLIQDHKSWGFVIFALAVVRLAWRGTSGMAPKLPEGTKAHERALAHGTHVALYALIFAVPISGWLMVTASPYNDPGYMQVRNMVFGLFAMPDPFPTGDHGLAETLETVHAWLWIAMMGVLGLHVAGALFHHFVRRDSILRRMIRGA